MTENVSSFCFSLFFLFFLVPLYSNFCYSFTFAFFLSKWRRINKDSFFKTKNETKRIWSHNSAIYFSNRINENYNSKWMQMKKDDFLLFFAIFSFFAQIALLWMDIAFSPSSVLCFILNLMNHWKVFPFFVFFFLYEKKKIIMKIICEKFIHVNPLMLLYFWIIFFVFCFSFFVGCARTRRILHVFVKNSVSQGIVWLWLML